MTTKTYTTIVGAYTSAEKAGAKIFGADYYGYAHRLDEILAGTYKSANARTLAKGNLRKLDKTLYALECTKDKTYKWTVIGHFDSDGLLYADAPKQTEDKPKKTPRKPTPAKGNGINFSKVSGKTKSDRNKSAHAMIVGIGVKPGTDEYKSLWEEWTKVR